MPCVVGVEGENACRFASGGNGKPGAFDRRLHVGMARIAEVAERGCKVGGADEQSVDALDRSYGLDLLQRGAAFDLRDDADAVVRVLQIVGVAAESRGAAGGAGDAAGAAGREARGCDDRPGLIRAVNHGHEQRGKADVEILFDMYRIADRNARDRVQRKGRDGL